MGYLGTEEIETSTLNQDIIPLPPNNWTIGYKIRRFEFINKQSCHVLINGKYRLFLDADQGFICTEKDEPITSFVIEEAGINYQFIGSY